jgi:arsenate reductase
VQTPIKILFLCTGNSCRSIIAEGLANQLGGGRVQAFSAGSQPSGKVNDNALAVLARHGVEMADPSSQSWDEYETVALDLVITVCDSAASESCPIWLGDAVKAHWGVVDPAYVAGSQAQIDAAFERTFSEMQSRITALLSLPLETMDARDLADAAKKIQQASV